MLVLKRRPQQAIQVGADITITVLGIEPGAVTFGITAPLETQIVRVVALNPNGSTSVMAYDEDAVAVPDGSAAAPKTTE